ncbi:GlcG/HbpS family heme-binding protein [Histidinibacterium lentulum]|uniref:Heme-binding protein n=1 Tax=Histidinibacterium lentulum TaxID=2480588 RepID=A0A3N2QR60_9RHOB|nr:heme-binding protein [Histidinibacterium lentulum]ROT97684.1 heme-binding protein [Histidinibacterium lentulum]
MTDTDRLARPTLRLAHAAALEMVALAAAEAERLSEPQCITIVDTGGTVIAQIRMDGARLNALAISETKARTSASTRAPSGDEPLSVALACGGRQTGLVGGLPIWLDGTHVGGIGVSSGPDEADLACARAAFALSPRLSASAP